MLNDAYMVRERNMEGNWYTVVKVVDGHMELMPYVHTYEEADCLVTKLSIGR